jgi:histidinol-phosphate phosphatase family protein
MNAPHATLRGAIFFDRDGTLIEDRHYIRDASEVALVAHAANAVRLVNYAQLPVIVVTNQSGIARGLLTEADYEAVRAQLDNLLSERNAFIDASYHCPHHPEFSGPCECRKPATELYRRAMDEHHLDPSRCAFIGDRLRDIVAARTFGGRGILVPSPDTPGEEIVRAAAEFEIAATLSAAVQLVLNSPPPASAGRLGA